jgi:hypothetical protein
MRGNFLTGKKPLSVFSVISVVKIIKEILTTEITERGLFLAENFTLK